jgi:two-component system sensor histidine kinase KdpD
MSTQPGRYRERQSLRRTVQESWPRWLAGGAASTIAVALAVALLQPLRTDLGLINVALLLLLLSVVSAAAWGWVVGLFTSVLSNLAFNWFFVPPLHEFSVEQPANALALGLFLLVAAITAALLARSRLSAHEASRRATETQMLLALSRTVRALPLERVPASICERVVQEFPVRACSLYRLAGDQFEPVAHTGNLAERLSRAEQSVALQAVRSGRPAGLDYKRHGHLRRHRRSSGSGSSDAEARPFPSQSSVRALVAPLRRGADETGRLFLPLGVEGTPVGVMRIGVAGRPLSDAQEELLEAFADETAAALQRASLAQSARTAAVLKESDRLKSALLSSVSHDLRTPLTGIKTSVANLMAPEVQWTDAARQEFLVAIDRETDRLTRLVTNLLDLSRIEAGALRLDRDWNDLDELLRNAADRVEQTAPERTVRLQIDDPLPLLHFDYVQIDRVVANLLDNAIKYSPPGTPVDLTARIDGDTIRIGVRDWGAGIPAGERQRVFDPFYRAERRQTSAGGSGLGLAICRGIVDAHGGRIWIDGEPGTLVSFTLPRTAITEARPVPDPERSREIVG